jgi:hypothetical protein
MVYWDGIILFIIKVLPEERRVECNSAVFNGRVQCSSWHSSLHNKSSLGVTVQDALVLHCLFNKADGRRMQSVLVGSRLMYYSDSMIC